MKRLAELCSVLTAELDDVCQQLQYREEQMKRIYKLGPNDQLVHQDGELIIVREVK
jgi:hypothetical protein